LEDWYYKRTGVCMDVDNPKTFNEKIQWLKLYDSTPLKTQLADKYLVREWVQEKLGGYLIPIIAVYDKFDDIDFDKLPNQFAMKATHGSAWNVIVKDKTKLDVAKTKKKFNKWMSTNFAFVNGLELHYKDMKPRIIIEEYLENGEYGLSDYKIWCFHGRAKYIQFVLGRTNHDAEKTGFYDLEWNKQDFSFEGRSYNDVIDRPKQLDKMIELANILAEDFSFVRVDFYLTNDGEIKFGEMTFTPQSGVCKWEPVRQDNLLGELLNIK